MAEKFEKPIQALNYIDYKVHSVDWDYCPDIRKNLVEAYNIVADALIELEEIKKNKEDDLK